MLCSEWPQELLKLLQVWWLKLSKVETGLEPSRGVWYYSRCRMRSKKKTISRCCVPAPRCKRHKNDRGGGGPWFTWQDSGHAQVALGSVRSTATLGVLDLSRGCTKCINRRRWLDVSSCTRSQCCTIRLVCIRRGDNTTKRLGSGRKQETHGSRSVRGRRHLFELTHERA